MVTNGSMTAAARGALLLVACCIRPTESFGPSLLPPPSTGGARGGVHPRVSGRAGGGRALPAPRAPRASFSSSTSSAASAATAASDADEEEEEEEVVDVIVIGSGIGGLSCAGLLAATGRTVKVLERHYEIGGCAHEFHVDHTTGRTIPTSAIRDSAHRRSLFHFEAGPSLYSGLSQERSPNPLKHVYQMIDEEPEWITYDRWGAFLPEAPDGYQMSIGAENFERILETYGGGGAVDEWNMLASKLRPMSAGVKGIPHASVRSDAGILLTVAAKYPISFMNILKNAPLFSESFDLDELGLKNEFLRNYLDMLAFLLQGLPADQTLKVVMAYMIEDFFREDAVMDFPKGGSGEMMAALARGVTKRGGCTVETSTSVDEVLVEDGRATGVRLAKSGRIVRAREAVVSNADLTSTFKFVKRGADAKFDDERDRYLGTTNDPKGGTVPYCRSFMHLHLGVKADLIPEDAPPQWTVVRDWSGGIDAPGNVVVVSVGSKLDPDLAPEGYHVIHAYTAGNEPYEEWERFEHLLDDPVARDKDEEYKKFKDDRSRPIWEAVQKWAPGVVAGSCTVEMVATPLTHARFLSRHRGNYGLAIAPGNEEGWKFPDVKTPIEGYYRCGDSTTSGIGVPAVASSGAICANTIMSVWDQLRLNSKIKMP